LIDHADVWASVVMVHDDVAPELFVVLEQMAVAALDVLRLGRIGQGRVSLSRVTTGRLVRPAATPPRLNHL
jgi:hypothetical protein